MPLGRPTNHRNPASLEKNWEFAGKLQLQFTAFCTESCTQVSLMLSVVDEAHTTPSC